MAMMMSRVIRPSSEPLPLRLPYPSRLTTSTSRSCSRITCSGQADSSGSSSSSPRRFHGVALSLAASLAVSLSGPTTASAATVKMGADEGTLVFVPSSISISAGEKVVFLNNRGFPHNVIFEKDGVPVGVQAELISHDDYMNEQGEQFVVILKEKGTYRFFCEPHRSAGMVGEIVVT